MHVVALYCKDSAVELEFTPLCIFALICVESLYHKLFKKSEKVQLTARQTTNAYVTLTQLNCFLNYYAFLIEDKQKI